MKTISCQNLSADFNDVFFIFLFFDLMNF